GRLAVHEPRDVGRVRRVAAHEQVRAELVDLARAAHGMERRLARAGIFTDQVWAARLADELLDVARGESGLGEQRLVGELDLGEDLPELLLVPLGELRELVVRDSVRGGLRLV